MNKAKYLIISAVIKIALFSIAVGFQLYVSYDTTGLSTNDTLKVLSDSLLKLIKFL
jgi:hypothetical protein